MNIRNKPWSDQEIDLIIADYFDMLEMDCLGKPYKKSNRNKAMQKRTGRSSGSIEYKHQNISAVLQDLGRPWIPGYKPRKNYQKALINGIERHLETHARAFAELDEQIIALAAKSNRMERLLELEPAPTIKADETKILRRLIRKYDPATRDARNRELGKLGEEQVLISERIRLTEAGRKDLAREIKWISQEEGDGAGYDILSFNTSGEERLLEVKTTPGHKYTPFYLTENERLLSIERPKEFRLMRLYNFGPSPKMMGWFVPLPRSASNGQNESVNIIAKAGRTDESDYASASSRLSGRGPV